MKKENFVLGDLPEKDQEELRNIFQTISDKFCDPPKPWSHFEFKYGDIVAVTNGSGREKVVLFPSTGKEWWDLEIAQRAGIDYPEFHFAATFLSGTYNDGLMVLWDKAAGITPPPGDTRLLRAGVDY